MDRRSFLGSLTAVLGMGKAVAGDAPIQADGWQTIREWTIPPDSVLRSLAPAAPVLLLNPLSGIGVESLLASFANIPKEERPRLAVFECNPMVSLSDAARVVSSPLPEDVPCFGVLEERGGKERFRLILPDRSVILNPEWAELALAPKQSE